MPGGDRPLIVALQLVLATFVVAVVPGGLAVVAWRATPSIGMLEWLAISVALSFGIVHLITVAMIVAHGGVPTLSGALVATLGAAGAWLAMARRTAATRVSIDIDDVIGLLFLVVLGALLYLQGSPVGEWEDQVHAAIVRRMAALPRLTLDKNLLPRARSRLHVPVSSTHALMAFITQLSNLDAMFVYHKLRFFWGPAALLMIYLGALAVFGRRAVATAALATAAVLTLTGVFAVVEGSYWGQLAVHSHASDIAMAVLLPALLALSYRYVDSDVKRERWMLLTAVALLLFMLTVVHIERSSQSGAYLGCFLAVSALYPPFRRNVRPTLLLLGLMFAIVALSVPWQSAAVGHITELVGDQRGRVLRVLTATPPSELFFAPASKVFSSFVLWIDATFHGLTQLLLLAGPVAVVFFRDRPLVWLIATSTFAYLVVMNVPVLASAYSPPDLLRNTRDPYTQHHTVPALDCWPSALRDRIVPVDVAASARRRCARDCWAGIAIGLLGYLAPLAANRTESGFFVQAILAWGSTFLFLGARRPATAAGRSRAVLAGIAAVSALVALWPDHLPPAPPRPSSTFAGPRASTTPPGWRWNTAFLDRTGAHERPEHPCTESGTSPHQMWRRSFGTLP